MEDKKLYTVYMHETPSGKKYVGITRDKVKSRWDSGWGYQNNPYFWNAIRKYGWNNIKHEILFTGLTEQEAKNKEIELISEMGLTNREKGYNRSAGGDLGNISRRKKIYMYDSNTGDFLKEFDSRNDAEKFLGIDSNTIGRSRKNPYEIRNGYMWRDEYYDKIDTHDYAYEIILIDKHSNMIITNFYKLESDFEYKGRIYKKSQVYKRCKDKTYIYYDIICCYASDYINMIQKISMRFVGVYKIDVDKNIILDAFPSYKKAAESVSGKDCCISDCCKHYQNTAYGYKWESIGLIKNENYSEKEKYIEKNYLYDENINTLNFYIFQKEDIKLITKE